MQHLAGGVAVIKETLYGPTHSPSLPHSPSRSRSPSPTRVAGKSGALLASHGTTQSPYMTPPFDYISPPGCSFCKHVLKNRGTHHSMADFASAFWWTEMLSCSVSR